MVILTQYYTILMAIDTLDESEQHAAWAVPRQVSNTEQSVQQRRWEALTQEVEQVKDGLDLGIDQGIKQSVVAFRAYDFPTSQSCEGHLEGEHGNPYPWVEVYAPEPEDWQENEEKQKEWTIENLKQQQRMMGLLSEFYQNRDIPFDARLAFDKVGAFGGFRVQSMGAETMRLLTKEELENRHQLYRKEMQDFTAFLKEEFLKR